MDLKLLNEINDNIDIISFFIRCAFEQASYIVVGVNFGKVLRK